MGRIFRHVLEIIGKNLPAYLVLNLFFYGLMVLSIVYVSNNPEVGRACHLQMKKSMEGGLLGLGYKLYWVQRSILLAFIFTFLVNLILGAAVYVTLPSFVIPFSGLAVLAYRFILWGLNTGPAGISHFVNAGTLFLEGQGYIIAALAIYLQGSRYVRWRHHGYESADAAFRKGFALTVRLYPIVAVVLFVAALFESVLVISTNRQNTSTSERFSPASAGSYTLTASGNSHSDFPGSQFIYEPADPTLKDAGAAGAMCGEAEHFRTIHTSSALPGRRGRAFDVEARFPLSNLKNTDVSDDYPYMF